MMRVPQHPQWSDPLYHEIFINDTYRLERLDFTPATVYDIGANYGCFAAKAKAMWPNCRVICVEPHPPNYEVLTGVVSTMQGVTTLQAGLGTGPLHWAAPSGGEDDPGGQGYLSLCAGYDQQDLQAIPVVECRHLTLADLFQEFPPTKPYLVKIDTEGAEQSLFGDQASNALLADAAYWTAELHFFAGHWEPTPKYQHRYLATHAHVILPCLEWLYCFCDTHFVELSLHACGGMAWMTRKPS
jgi:FkbM family methyltransferase